MKQAGDSNNMGQESCQAQISLQNCVQADPIYGLGPQAQQIRRIPFLPETW
jgi:hypothetical protein